MVPMNTSLDVMTLDNGEISLDRSSDMRRKVDARHKTKESKADRSSAEGPERLLTANFETRFSSRTRLTSSCQRSGSTCVYTRHPTQVMWAYRWLRPVDQRLINSPTVQRKRRENCKRALLCDCRLRTNRHDTRAASVAVKAWRQWLPTFLETNPVFVSPCGVLQG